MAAALRDDTTTTYAAGVVATQCDFHRNIFLTECLQTHKQIRCDAALLGGKVQNAPREPGLTLPGEMASVFECQTCPAGPACRTMRAIFINRKTWELIIVATRFYCVRGFCFRLKAAFASLVDHFQ